MTDLTKLTAAQFMDRCKTYQPIYVETRLFDEIRLRLERLEQCEVLSKYARHHGSCSWHFNLPCTCGYDAARAVVEGK